VGTLEDIDFVGEVRLVHTVDDDLTRLRVGGHLERQILGNERGDRKASLSWSAIDFGSTAISIRQGGL
jgi:hypothetical protein